MKATDPSVTTTIRLPEILHISRAHIEQMDEAFNSPVCDLTADNAVALALTDAMGGHRVRVGIAKLDPERAYAMLSGERFALPAAAGEVLIQALTGGRPGATRLRLRETSARPRKIAQDPKLARQLVRSERGHPSAAWTTTPTQQNKRQ